jgi:hypothetical protein
LTVSSEHLQSLLVYCVNFGKQMLETSGAFYPFGAVLDPSGKLEAVGGWNGNEHPDPAEIYKLLSDALRARATGGEISAAALAVDVNIPARYAPMWPDGIRVRLESASFSRYVYVPYRIGKSGSARIVETVEPVTVVIGHELFLSKGG